MLKSPLPLGGGVLLIVILVAAGGLAWPWGLAGLLWLGLSAALLPHRSGGPGASQTQPGATGQHTDAARAHAPLWRQLVDAIPDPVLVLDQRQHVIAINGGAALLFPAAEGRHITQIHRSPELLSAVDQALGTLATRPFDMHTIVPAPRHLSGLATPLGPEQGQPASPALLVVLRDRTEAEHLAQMRADFVANASHELRTPLASLKGFVETLQGAARDDPEARERFLAIMQNEAARMSRLIEDLLSLSRIEMREHVAPTGLVDLVPLVTEIVAALRPLADAAGIALGFAPSEHRLAVAGDRDELLQAAQNLIQNAIKYGKRGGRVDVTLERNERRAILAVADDGRGIAPEHLPRLTERFYRVSAKDSRERGGTGLGLAIVKHIVNRHRGELRITSTLGKGSTFSIELPSA